MYIFTILVGLAASRVSGRECQGTKECKNELTCSDTEIIAGNKMM